MTPSSVGFFGSVGTTRRTATTFDKSDSHFDLANSFCVHINNRAKEMLTCKHSQ